jgi:folate-binding protein YgfZ
MTACLQFQRLLVTGRDRARFLHNFCTNAVRELPQGRSVEAFFVDVKARVLAHGYVLALPERHEVHVLGVAGAADVLLRHLDRYIITEDVQLRCVGADQQGQLWLLPDSSAQVSARFSETGCESLPHEGVRHVFRWSVGTMCVVAGVGEVVAGAVDEFPAGAVGGTAGLVESWRIDECFPVVGVDVTEQHLAPEADRNVQAVSYQKGCYLGQEPIARIDALGHVNRALRRICVTGLDVSESAAESAAELWRGAELRGADGVVLGQFSSFQQQAGTDRGAGLALVRLSAVPVSVVRADGVGCVVQSVGRAAETVGGAVRGAEAK